MKNKYPNYQSFIDALETVEAELSPSEIQGLHLGLICGSNRKEQNVWHHSTCREILGESLEDDLVSSYNLQLLTATLEGITNGDASLRLYLPDDKESLFFRSDMLSSWCDGFLYGLGMSGFDKQQLDQSDVSEFLKDVSQISLIGVDENDTSEESERDFMELCEYLRIGVMTIFEEVAKKKWANESSSFH